MVPAAVGRNNEYCETLIAVGGLISLRMPLRTPLSDCETMVEETEEGVREESIVRRQAARPATCGVAMEVPEMELVPPSFQVEMTWVPK